MTPHLVNRRELRPGWEAVSISPRTETRQSDPPERSQPSVIHSRTNHIAHEVLNHERRTLGSACPKLTCSLLGTNQHLVFYD